MQHLEVSGAVRPLKSSLGVKRLNGLVRFAERPNLASARVPSRFERAIQMTVYRVDSKFVKWFML